MRDEWPEYVLAIAGMVLLVGGVYLVAFHPLHGIAAILMYYVMRKVMRDED